MRLFETRIRRNIRLAESPSFGQSIFSYAPTRPGPKITAPSGGELLAYYAGRVRCSTAVPRRRLLPGRESTVHLLFRLLEPRFSYQQMPRRFGRYAARSSNFAGWVVPATGKSPMRPAGSHAAGR